MVCLVRAFLPACLPACLPARQVESIEEEEDLQKLKEAKRLVKVRQALSQFGHRIAAQSTVARRRLLTRPQLQCE